MKTARLILGGLFLANVLAWLVIWELRGESGLEVNFFDVGQGDSILTEWTQYIPSYLRLSFLA